MRNSIRIATRKSKLALWQAHFVKSAIEKKYPKLQISLLEMLTEGDQQQTISLKDVGGKSNFVKTLQKALLKNEADIAVHSIKDLSAYPTEGLILAAICEREDARDTFISNHFDHLDAMPEGAIVGTASPRRSCLIQNLRPDLHIQLIRGNVDTRLSKLDSSEYDAIILAAAGLNRLELSHRIRSFFPKNTFVPAIGQGAIGIECKENDTEMKNLLQFLNHEITALCVNAERYVNQILNGDCHTPLGAHAIINEDKIMMDAMIGSIDGKIVLRANGSTSLDKSILLAESIAHQLIDQGAMRL